jgi:hypothetical protein
VVVPEAFAVEAVSGAKDSPAGWTFEPLDVELADGGSRSGAVMDGPSVTWALSVELPPLCLHATKLLVRRNRTDILIMLYLLIGVSDVG